MLPMALHLSLDIGSLGHAVGPFLMLYRVCLSDSGPSQALLVCHCINIFYHLRMGER